MEKLIFIVFTFFVLVLGANAQSLNLFMKNGTQSQYLLSEIKKQTFTSTEMIITTTNETVLTFNLGDIRKFTFGLTTDVVEKIDNVEIESIVYPNPTTGFMNVDFSLTENGKVDISIFSIDGKFISNILSEEKLKGTYSLNWQNENLPIGTYFVKIQTENNLTTKKIVIIK